jgi:hypothetical protein
MHPDIDNRTPLPFELLFLADEEGRPLVTPLAQATFRIVEGRLQLAEEQLPLALAGERNTPREETPTDPPMEGVPPSWRLEPEAAFVKPGVDVVLLGHAYAPRGRATSSEVVLRVGRFEKRVRVSGERVFVDVGTGIRISSPRPFERLPLQWEYAFGGAEVSNGSVVAFDKRNPVGRGFRGPRARFVEDVFLPNLEDPAAPLTRWGQPVPPAGFGFVSGEWEPRSALAGTYGQAWEEERSPLLPADFDRKFFNGAPEDQVLELRGDEQVEVVGASARGPLRFALPELQPLRGRLVLQDREEMLQLAFDTIVIDAEAGVVRVLFRAHAPLQRGAFDVKALTVRGPEIGALAAELRAREPPPRHTEDEEEDVEAESGGAVNDAGVA